MGLGDGANKATFDAHDIHFDLFDAAYEEETLSLFSVLDELESPGVFTITPSEPEGYIDYSAPPRRDDDPPRAVAPQDTDVDLDTSDGASEQSEKTSLPFSLRNKQQTILPKLHTNVPYKVEQSQGKLGLKEEPKKGKRRRQRRTGPASLKLSKKPSRCLKALESYNNVPLARLLPRSTKRVIKRPGSYTVGSRRRTRRK